MAKQSNHLETYQRSEMRSILGRDISRFYAKNVAYGLKAVLDKPVALARHHNHPRDIGFYG